MRSILPDWEIELARWLKPFLEQLGHKARRRMCPLYVAGLIGPGDRKSVQPMAERLAPGDYDQLHHFVAAGIRDAAPASGFRIEKVAALQAVMRAIHQPTLIVWPGKQGCPGWRWGSQGFSPELSHMNANEHRR